MFKPQLLVLALFFYGCNTSDEPEQQGTVDPNTSDASIEPQVKFAGNLPADGDTSESVSITVKAGNSATTSYQWAWASDAGNCEAVTSYTDVADFNTKIEIAETGDDGTKIVCVKGKGSDDKVQHTALAHSWTKGDNVSVVEQVEKNLAVVVSAEGLSVGDTSAATELSFTVAQATNSAATHYRYVFIPEPGDDENSFAAKCREGTLSEDHALDTAIYLNAQTLGSAGKKLLCVEGLKDTEDARAFAVFWWTKSDDPTATLFNAQNFFRSKAVLAKTKVTLLVLGEGNANRYKYLFYEGNKYHSCAALDWSSAGVVEGELGTELTHEKYNQAGALILSGISADVDKNYKTLCLIGLNDSAAQADANRYTWSYRSRGSDLADGRPYSLNFSSGEKIIYRGYFENLSDAAVNYTIKVSETTSYDYFNYMLVKRDDLQSSDWTGIGKESKAISNVSLAAGETRYLRIKLRTNFKTDFKQDEYTIKLLIKAEGKDDVEISAKIFVPKLEVVDGGFSSKNVLNKKTTERHLGNTKISAHRHFTIRNVGHEKSKLYWHAFATTQKHNWFYYTFKKGDKNGGYKSVSFAEIHTIASLRKNEAVILQVGMSCRDKTSMAQKNCDKSLWPKQQGSVTMRIVSNGKSESVPSGTKEVYPYVAGGTKVVETIQNNNNKLSTRELLIKWRTDLFRDVKLIHTKPKN